MSSKMLLINSCSRIEAELLDEELTNDFLSADSFTNPSWNNLVGRHIIIDLLSDVNYKKLGRYNKLVSRIPLPGDKVKYELVPFEDPEFKVNPTPKPYSKWILNKFMLLNESYNIKSDDRFLLGTDPTTDGYPNLVGYLILKTVKQ